MSLQNLELTIERARNALINGDHAVLSDISAEIQSALPTLSLLEAERLQALQQNAGRAQELALAALQGVEAAKSRVRATRASSFYDQNGRRETLETSPTTGHRRF